MKQLLFVFTLLTLCFSMVSCTTTAQFTMISTIDYSEFTKRGIFVTEANSVSFDYQPIGSVFSVSQGEMKGFVFYNISNVNLNKVFQEMAEKLSDMGANGLINLKITSLEANAVTIKVSVSGMAIRTKEPIVDTKFIAKPKEQKNDIHVDGIHCFISKQFKSGVSVITEQKLSIEQIRRAVPEFNIQGKVLQFFLPNTKDSYAGVTDNGYIVNYETNEFISL